MQGHVRTKMVFSVCFLVTVFLYSVGHAGLLYSIKDESGLPNDDTLVSIDTTSLAITEIGKVGIETTSGGLAYDPNTETLYMINGRNIANDLFALYTVDISTGAATLVGMHGVERLSGLAFDSTNNVLYASTNGNSTNPGLYRLDTITGAATFIGGQEYSGLGYDSNRDRLIGMGPGIGGTTGTLHVVDRATGGGEAFAGYLNVSTHYGLAYDSDLDVFWNTNNVSQLFSYPAAAFFPQTIHIDDISTLIRRDSLAYSPRGGIVFFTDIALEKAKVLFGESPGLVNLVKLKGTVSLNVNSDGIDPVQEEVVVQVGTDSTTIPAGSFLAVGAKHSYVGNIGGADVEMTIKSSGFGEFEFKFVMTGAEIPEMPNPLNVKLIVGDDEGTTSIWLPGKLKLNP